MNKKSISMKTLVAIVIAISLLFSSLINANAAEKKRYIGTLTENVKVRKGPNTQAVAIGSLPAGSIVELVASVAVGKKADGFTADKNFYKLAAGGYVAASYVKVTIQTADDNVSNQSVVILPESASPEPPDPGVDVATPTLKPTPTPSTGNNSSSSSIKKMVATANVNVRAIPSTLGQITNRCNVGASVTVVDYYSTGDTVAGIVVSGKWYKLSSGGYISADYLKPDDNKSNASQVIVGTTTYATAITDATMYATPIILGAKMGTLLKGESKIVADIYKNGSTVGSVKSIIGTWYKLSNGYYIQGSKVSLTTKQDETKVTSTNLIVGDGVMAKTNVNLRSGPGTNYVKMRLMVARETDIVEEIIKDGSTFNGVKVSGIWIKLLKSNGYVRVDYLIFNPESTIMVE